MTPESFTTGCISDYEVTEFSAVGNEVYRNVHFYRGTKEQIEQQARFFLSTREGFDPDGEEITWNLEDQHATNVDRSLRTDAGVFSVAARKICGTEDIHYINLFDPS